MNGGSNGIMTKLKLCRRDTVDYLKTDEDMADYLETCIAKAGADATFIAAALGDIAGKKGMTRLARDMGLSRG